MQSFSHIVFCGSVSHPYSAMQELEKKFSQTGAYKNLKKMLASKNDQIKELRQKLGASGGGSSSSGRANMMHGAEDEEEEEEE